MAVKLKDKPQPTKFFYLENEGKLPEGTKVLWKPNPGPQTRVLLRSEYEILYGGAKGGGKSEAGRVWLISGNPGKNGCPTDISYINHPEYRAVALRKNRIDMQDWVGRAAAFYKNFGGVLKQEPMTYFEFPTGSIITVGHLAEEGAYEKYTGNEVHRVLVEEATQIPSEELYEMVIANCRSKFSELRPQVFLTANPGGPGHGWVSKRFKTSDPSTYDKQLRIHSINPISGKEITTTRIFVPAKVTDNPALLEHDPGYPDRLAANLSPQKARALLGGDWNALVGQYFDEFSTEHHVADPANVSLASWYSRWIAMDVGYAHDSAVGWFCRNEADGRLYQYRELVKSNTDYDELGVEIARTSLAELEQLPEHSMPLVLSPDAFSKTDAHKTRAEQIASGIRKVLGEGSCFLVQLSESEKQMDKAAAWVSMQQRFSQLDGKLMISIFRANNSRVDGWGYMHQLFRWIAGQADPVPDMEYARSLLVLPNGSDKYLEYLRKFQKQKSEPLPKLKIFKTCPRTITSILAAVHKDSDPEDVKKTDGDDSVDMLRYGCMYWSDRVANKPLGIHLGERMAKAHDLGIDTDDPTVRVQVARRVIEQYGQQVDTNPFATIQRAGRKSHWRM